MRDAILSAAKKNKETVLFNDKIVDGKTSIYSWDYNKSFFENLTLLVSPYSTLVLNKRDNIYIISKKRVKKEVKIVEKEKKITGRVTYNRIPLAYAMVYVANSDIGTYTDSLGYYELTNVKGKKVDLVANLIGYESQIVDIFLDGEYEHYKYDFSLRKSSVYTSDAIIVYGEEDFEWQKNYNQFRNAFLGYSNFSRECEILNPEVIEFEKVGNHVYGYSDKIIEIENKALGYKVYFLLKNFRISSDGYTHYIGYPKFEELKSGTKEEYNKWLENRELAYYGSQKHFFKSLFKSSLEDEDFSLKRSKFLNIKIDKNVFKRFNPLDISKHITDVNENVKLIQLNGYLLVKLNFQYNGDFYDKSKGSLFNSDRMICSAIDCTNTIMFDKNGNIMNDDVESLGFFSFYRVSGLLPNSYEID